MFYYAQIDENNICIGVSQLSGEIQLPSMILLNNFDVSLLGKRYNNGVWEDVEQPEPTVPEPTDLEILMQAQADAELRDFEIQRGQELLAQQMADIELAVLGGAV